MTPIPHNLSQNTEQERPLHNSHEETSIALTPKPDRDTTRKLQTLSMSWAIQILNNNKTKGNLALQTKDNTSGPCMALGMQGWFDHQSIDVIHHINSQIRKSHVIISTGAEETEVLEGPVTCPRLPCCLDSDPKHWWQKLGPWELCKSVIQSNRLIVILIM